MKNNSASEDVSKLLGDSDGFVLIFLKSGKLSSRLEGDYRQIFDRLFDEKPAMQKAGCCRGCKNCTCSTQQ